MDVKRRKTHERRGQGEERREATGSAKMATAHSQRGVSGLMVTEMSSDSATATAAAASLKKITRDSSIQDMLDVRRDTRFKRFHIALPGVASCILLPVIAFCVRWEDTSLRTAPLMSKRLPLATSA